MDSDSLTLGTKPAATPQSGRVARAIQTPDSPPIFVVGCPRSGTTLVARLLADTIWREPVETHFITKYAPRFPGTNCSPQALARFLAKILAERPVMQWKLTVDPHELAKQCVGQSYAEIVDHICMLRFSQLGARSWADKTPHYCLQLETIHELFPQSKFIFLVRDGRDVALSLLRKSWGPSNVYSCAQYWNECNESQAIHRKLIGQHLMHFVRYEDLLKDPHQELVKLFGFLEQPYGASLRTNAERLIRTDNQGKFKHQLSAKQLQVFESVAGVTLEHYGYAATQTRLAIPAWERLGYWLHDRLALAHHLFMLNVVDEINIRFLGKEPFAE